MLRFLSFVMLPILLTSGGEFLLKHNINAEEAVQVSTGLLPHLNLFSIMGVLSIFIGGNLWLIAMSKYELSFLYPFYCLNFLIITVGSQLLLGESVSLYRYAAVMLIITGLIFISRSSYSQSTKET